MFSPDALFIDLVRAETRLYNVVDVRIRAEHGGMSVGQLQLLRVIGDMPDCRVSDLVRAVDITVGAASKAVDRLEADGLCRRRANPGDRRSSVLELTAGGERALATGWPTLTAAVADLVGGAVSEAELEQLAGTLAALRAALESAADRRDDG